jgi:tRNA(fMet)-specific endonuclease VapC
LPVLLCDVDVAWRYGEVKKLLRDKGRPIPENDIWIAAIALKHDLTLATRDVHFGEVTGLKTAAW